MQLGTDVKACVEMMSGAVWVRDQLRSARLAGRGRRRAPGQGGSRRLPARPTGSTRACSPSCAGAISCPALWIPSLEERELRERLRRRMHLVRLRTSAMNRVYGLRHPVGAAAERRRGCARSDGLELLARSGMPAVWRRSIEEALAVIDLLDERIAPLDAELKPIARADPDVALLVTIPGVGDLLALTIAAEIGDISRFASARKLVGYAGMAPGVNQSGDRAKRGLPLSQGRLAGRCAGPRSKPPSTPGASRTPGTSSTRPRQPRQRQRRQVRRRTQDPDRRLAHALPPTTVQAKPPPRRRQHCPGKLHSAFWPHDGPSAELRSRDSSNEHLSHPRTERELSTHNPRTKGARSNDRLLKGLT